MNPQIKITLNIQVDQYLRKDSLRLVLFNRSNKVEAKSIRSNGVHNRYHQLNTTYLKQLKVTE